MLKMVTPLAGFGAFFVPDLTGVIFEPALEYVSAMADVVMPSAATIVVAAMASFFIFPPGELLH
jgi:hypothetical protein